MIYRVHIHKYIPATADEFLVAANALVLTELSPLVIIKSRSTIPADSLTTTSLPSIHATKEKFHYKYNVHLYNKHDCTLTSNWYLLEWKWKSIRNFSTKTIPKPPEQIKTR